MARVNKMKLEDVFTGGGNYEIELANGSVDVSGKYEVKSNKVIVIDDETSDSVESYPSVKAVTDYVKDTVGDGVAEKMDKHLLTISGATIYDNDTVCTHEYLKNLLLNTEAFAVLVYGDIAYHPNTINDDVVEFISTDTVNGVITTNYIGLKKDNTLSVSKGEAEKISNKSSTIDNSTSKYPSNKAVKDYVDRGLAEKIDEEARAEISEIKADFRNLKDKVKGMVVDDNNGNLSFIFATAHDDDNGNLTITGGAE